MGLLSQFIYFWFCYTIIIDVIGASSDDGVTPLKLQLNSETGEQYNLRLSRANEADSVLHPDIKVLNVRRSAQNGQLVFDSRSPSQDELQSAQDVYIDEGNKAAVRFKRGDANGQGPQEMEGVVNGRRVTTRSDGSPVLAGKSQNQSDYIDFGSSYTPLNQRQGNRKDAIVETCVVVDKEFADVFNHDRQAILDYFTIYFWDVSMAYQTLPSSNIKFRITSIVIISSTDAQPFIEESRDSDGVASMNSILPKFSYWIYEVRESIPHYDIAVIITNTHLTWYGGLAYMNAACGIDHNGGWHWGVSVWHDNGGWGSCAIGSHEIGHNLGAPHDDAQECEDLEHGQSQYMFSQCSDRMMSRFINSKEASCLQTIDAAEAPTIDTNFNSVLAPDRNEQCRRRMNNPDAVTGDEEDDCTGLTCWVLVDGTWWKHWLSRPVENTPCKKDGVSGRCFHGMCRKEAKLFKNVGTGECMRTSDSFSDQAIVAMVDCSNSGIGDPKDRFTITDKDNGKHLATPFSTKDAKEFEEACVWTGSGEGDALWAGRCNMDNPWGGWNFLEVGNGEFLLQHRITGRCAQPNGPHITVHEDCSRDEAGLRWKLY